MKKLIAVAVVVAAFVTIGCVEVPAGVPMSTPVFVDVMTDGYDPTIWAVRDNGDSYGSKQGMLQKYYANQIDYDTNDGLNIHADWTGSEVRSGFLTTRALNGQPAKKSWEVPFYAEASIKVPVNNPVVWPAFWVVGRGNPGDPVWPYYGEFDVLEYYGSSNKYENNFHYKNSAGQDAALAAGQYLNVPEGFERYGVYVTEDYVEWYFNGTMVRHHDFTADQKDTELGPHSINLNLQIGGDVLQTYHGWDPVADPPSAHLPAVMEVYAVGVWTT